MIEIISIGLIVFIVVVGLWLMMEYNSFVTLKTQLEASIQEIGNQLKRQADLIPNLVSSVKGYMSHEQAALDKITEARKQVLDVVNTGAGDAQQLLTLGDSLQKAMAPIRAIFESTPELKADGPTQKLMDELRDTADKLMYSRRTLIDLTADYNIKVVTFPSNLVAKMFGFMKEKGLATPETGAHVEVSAAETVTPKVEL